MIQEPLPICLNKPDDRGFFHEIQVGRFTKISFKRTLRVPDDGKTYDLPAGLGSFPIHRVEDYANKVPNSWLKEGGFFIPMYQKEALYVNFEGIDWHPNIAKICVGRINAITAEQYSEQLSQIKQDYVVIPTQQWLDGVATGKNKVRQFVATPLGHGYTIEAQMTDEEIHGGFQITVIDAKDGKFPERDVTKEEILLRTRREEKLLDLLEGGGTSDVLYQMGGTTEQRSDFLGFSMGIAPGGMIKQQIFKDRHGRETWDLAKQFSFTIHLVNSAEYKSITGFDPPSVPINAKTYQLYGMPWFDFYDEIQPTVEPPSAFKRLLSVASIECRRFFQTKEPEIIITEELIQKIKTPSKEEAIKKYRDKANHHFREKDWAIAKKDISFVIDFADTTTHQDYFLRSICNLELENYREADIDAQFALENNDTDIRTINVRAICLLKLEKYEEMISFAEDIIEIVENEVNKKSNIDSESLNSLMKSGLELKALGLMYSGQLEEAFKNANELKKCYPNEQQSDVILARIAEIDAQNGGDAISYGSTSVKIDNINQSLNESQTQTSQHEAPVDDEIRQLIGMANAVIGMAQEAGGIIDHKKVKNALKDLVESQDKVAGKPIADKKLISARLVIRDNFDRIYDAVDDDGKLKLLGLMMNHIRSKQRKM